MFRPSLKALEVLLYLPLHGFCIDLPEARLRTDRNM